MIGGTEPRVAVVIGGASGIGLASAHRLAADGATVVIADLDGDRAARAAAEMGPESWSQAVQVTDEATVEALFSEVHSRHGRLDVVVNTAGTNIVAPITDMSVEDWRLVQDVSLTGAFLVIKHAARRMAAEASIVTIASLNARQAASGMSAYCAAKAGVVMLTEVAALELGPRGIRVNAISPGLVDTPLVAPLFTLPGLEGEYLDNTPLGRVGTPEEVADAVAYLSQAGSWVTGEVLNINGGAHTRRYPDVPGAIAAATAAAGS